MARSSSQSSTIGTARGRMLSRPTTQAARVSRETALRDALAVVSISQGSSLLWRWFARSLVSLLQLCRGLLLCIVCWAFLQAVVKAGPFLVLCVLAWGLRSWLLTKKRYVDSSGRRRAGGNARVVDPAGARAFGGNLNRQVVEHGYSCKNSVGNPSWRVH